MDQMTSSASPNKRVKLTETEASDQDQEGSNFDRLPDEMLELILDFVQTTSTDGEKHPDHKTTRLVCQRWNKICGPKLQYQGVLKADKVESFVQLNPEIKLKSLVLSDLGNNHVRRVSRRLQGDDSLPSKNDEGGMDYDPSLFERSVEHLIVGGEAGFFLRRHGKKELPYSLSTGFAENQRLLLDVVRSISGSELMAIVKQLRDVKTLTLSSVAFLSVTNLNLRKIDLAQNFSNLTTLDLCVGKKSDPSKLDTFFANTTFPVLTSLYIRVYAVTFHYSLYVNFYRFISKHALLKNLSLSQAQAIYGFPKANYNYPELQVSAQPGLYENLMKIKLECLRMDCLIMGHEIAAPWKRLELDFIKNQTQLRGLELQVNLRSLEATLDQLLPDCGKTLERLELTSTNTTPNHFDCSFLSSFTKLKECHLCLKNYFHPRQTLFRTSSLSGILMLPASIKSLHLCRLPTASELNHLKGRLVNLNRISYSCSEMSVTEFCMTQLDFLEVLLDHLKFPRLVEFRMYTYACPTVTEFVHRQDGLVAYIEDEDSVVVLVDRDELNLEAFRERVTTTFNCQACSCETCSRHLVIWH